LLAWVPFRSPRSPQFPRNFGAMSETQVAALPTPPDLPTELPPASEGEPAALRNYREHAGEERYFVTARREFRETQDWDAMAKLMVLHSANVERSAKTAELALQAAEIWIERTKNLADAARAVARALEAEPANPRAYERLHKLYRELGWELEFERLLRWRIMFLSLADPTALPQAHLELARVYEHEKLALSKAVHHYKIALRQRPDLTEAIDRMIALYLGAGAWTEAAQLMNDELGRLQPGRDADRIAELHLRLARIE